VCVHQPLKVAGQVERANNKSYSILGCINRGTEYISEGHSPVEFSSRRTVGDGSLNILKAE